MSQAGSDPARPADPADGVEAVGGDAVDDAGAVDAGGEASPTRSTAGHPAGRKVRRRSEQNYTAAVYGSVLAASVVISAGDLRAPLVLAVLLISSGLVFWISHVYAATVASVHGGWHYGAISRGMAHEWPVAFAAVPPAIAALVSGLLPNFTVSDGVWAALIVAVAEQQLWGYAAVRHAKLSGPALTRTILLNVFVGLVIVALKVSIPGR